MSRVNRSSCGAHIPFAEYPSWGEWCVPCQTRIKLETPWYVPGMKMEDMAQAEANWKLEHGSKPLLELNSCPFCGGEQGDLNSQIVTGPRISTGKRGPYLIECRCGAMGSPSPTPELAAQMWNRRVGREQLLEQCANIARTECKCPGDPTGKTKCYGCRIADAILAQK